MSVQTSWPGQDPPQHKPDIDKILDDVFEMGVNHGKGRWNDYPALKKGAKQALYHRLAAEAVEYIETVENLGVTSGYHRTIKVKAVPISVVKAIMEIEE